MQLVHGWAIPAREARRLLAARYLTFANAWRLVLGGFSALIVLSIAVLQLDHVNDKFQVDATSGVWISLSRSAASGLLYPPLFDGTYYGGTRYMPIPILLPAGLDKLLGNLLVSEKLLTYFFAFLTFGLVYAILRRAGSERLPALALVGGLLATRTGLEAAVAIRWDAPALLCSLAALAVVERRRDPKALVAAGFLCSLAFASKLSAVWAPAAILLWLALYERRRLWVFVCGLAGSLAVLIGTFELASSGRLSKNVLALSLSAYRHRQGVGEHPGGVHFALSILRLDLPGTARVALLLAPFAAVAIGYAVVRHRLSLYHLALPIAALVVFFVYFDPGASTNHLIDVSALTAIVAGSFWAELRARPGALTWTGAAALAAMLLAVGFDPHGWMLTAALLGTAALVAGLVWWTLRSGLEFTWLGAALTVVVVLGGLQFYRQAGFLPEVKVALKSLAGHGDDRYTTRPLAGYVDARDTILAEDPSIPALLGERPVVLDPFAFDRLIRSHPDWSRKLAARVEARDFDELVLQSPIRKADEHFGPEVDAAIEKDYRLAERVRTAASGDAWIYLPAPRR